MTNDFFLLYSKIFMFLMCLNPLQSFFTILKLSHLWSVGASSLGSSVLPTWFQYSCIASLLSRFERDNQADYIFCPRTILPQLFFQVVLFRWDLIFGDHNSDVWGIHYNWVFIVSRYFQWTELVNTVLRKRNKILNYWYFHFRKDFLLSFDFMY